MPIRIDNDLPVKHILEEENIFNNTVSPDKMIRQLCEKGVKDSPCLVREWKQMQT